MFVTNTYILTNFRVKEGKSLYKNFYYAIEVHRSCDNNCNNRNNSKLNNNLACQSITQALAKGKHTHGEYMSDGKKQKGNKYETK